MTIKTAILCVCTMLWQVFFDNLRPVMMNKVALAQMSNDDFALTMLNGYNTITNVLPFVWLVICVLMYSKEIKLIIKYAKEKYNEEN